MSEDNNSDEEKVTNAMADLQVQGYTVEVTRVKKFQYDAVSVSGVEDPLDNVTILVAKK